MRFSFVWFVSLGGENSQIPQLGGPLMTTSKGEKKVTVIVLEGGLAKKKESQIFLESVIPRGL